LPAARSSAIAIDRPLPLPLSGRFSAARRAQLKRVFETVPAVITLFAISLLFWLPLVAPTVFIALLLSFHGYWTWRSTMNGTHAVKGYRLLKRHEKTDWRAEYDTRVGAGARVLAWDEIRHIVIVPNYTESADKLRMCLESIARSERPDQVIVVMAMEEREGDPGYEKAALLVREYEGRVGRIMATFHPWGLPGEVVGKSSNENWAARRAKEQIVDREGYNLDHITVTSCDADTVFDPKYFTCLTYHFATDERRHRRFWQAPIFFYNNIWDIPAPTRMAHCVSGLNHTARLSRSFFRMLFPQSTYSLSLRMAHEVDYWDPDIIPEDWHMFLKCYYNLKGEVDVETMYTKIYMDGVLAHGTISTYVNYFQQSRRHAWGATDIAYAVQQTLDHPEIPLLSRLRRVWAVAECHLLWTTQWFMITTAKVIPFAVAAVVGASVPTWYPVASYWIMLPCLPTLILLLSLDFMLRPKRPRHFKLWHYPVQYGIYFFMAFITFFTSALPALDAQIRLALGKRLEYRVTEKA
jgi:hypothetical protein